MSVSKHLFSLKVCILDVADVPRCHSDCNYNGSRIVAKEFILIHVIKFVHVILIFQLSADSRKYILGFILVIHHVAQEAGIDPLKHNVALEEASHLVCYIIDFLERIGYLNNRVVYSIDIESFIHQFLPKV